MTVKVTVFVGMAAMIVAAACGGGQPEVVTPAIDSTAIRDSIAREEARRRAYEDSVRRAREEEDRLRREREEAARREAAQILSSRMDAGFVAEIDSHRRPECAIAADSGRRRSTLQQA